MGRRSRWVSPPRRWTASSTGRSLTQHVKGITMWTSKYQSLSVSSRLEPAASPRPGVNAWRCLTRSVTRREWMTVILARSGNQDRTSFTRRNVFSLLTWRNLQLLINIKKRKLAVVFIFKYSIPFQSTSKELNWMILIQFNESFQSISNLGSRLSCDIYSFFHHPQIYLQVVTDLNDIHSIISQILYASQSFHHLPIYLPVVTDFNDIHSTTIQFLHSPSNLHSIHNYWFWFLVL